MTAIGQSWTAGRRVNVTNDPSSFIWRLKTSNYHAKLPINYDGWAPRQPSEGASFCLLLDQATNYLWNDVGCASYSNAVCEIDIA